MARIFVNPAIKRALCRDAGADRAWLSKIRPMFGHNYHFHIRLSCPTGEEGCADQEPPAPAATAAAPSSTAGSREAMLQPEARRQAAPADD